jgi:hypothetical protein
MVIGARPSVGRTVAPILRSGAATRSTGRRRRDSSPVSTVRNGRPPRAPASMRIVEPEFSASRTASGARQAPTPLPSIATSAPSRRISTPRPRRQARVEAQSAAEE